MKIEDRDGFVGIADERFVVGDVLGDQMFVTERELGVANDFGDVVLPFEGDAAEIGLVADFII